MTPEEFDAKIRKVALEFVGDYIRYAVGLGLSREEIRRDQDLRDFWERWCK